MVYLTPEREKFKGEISDCEKVLKAGDKALGVHWEGVLGAIKASSQKSKTARFRPLATMRATR